ncbi:MAG: hypothetical protein JWP78_2311, partial [Mucilaginibacter sp.]|nr:hypothetical protein [Mucilaginibacter sp.]
MYRLIFVLLLLLQGHISYAKPTDTTKIHKSHRVLADSVVEALNKKNQLLETQNEIMGTALNTHSSIFSGLSTYFAVISI